MLLKNRLYPYPVITQFGDTTSYANAKFTLSYEKAEDEKKDVCRERDPAPAAGSDHSPEGDRPAQWAQGEEAGFPCAVYRRSRDRGDLDQCGGDRV